jgi:hypothetical protein
MEMSGECTDPVLRGTCGNQIVGPFRVLVLTADRHLSIGHDQAVRTARC